MSVTFTPKQSWIALFMFGALLTFSVYNASLNIGLQNISDQRQNISDQRALNATKERHVDLQHSQAILKDTQDIQANVTIGLQKNYEAIQSLNFTHQQILNALQNRSG